ncbi:uncharacterized protein DS421_14g462890 [Arachis hypogaea]|nr:uncharacterized protein DS421_14g462890 [Arachis hypogaea]
MDLYYIILSPCYKKNSWSKKNQFFQKNWSLNNWSNQTNLDWSVNILNFGSKFVFSITAV